MTLHIWAIRDYLDTGDKDLIDYVVLNQSEHNEQSLEFYHDDLYTWNKYKDGSKCKYLGEFKY